MYINYRIHLALSLFKHDSSEQQRKLLYAIDILYGEYLRAEEQFQKGIWNIWLMLLWYWHGRCFEIKSFRNKLF